MNGLFKKSILLREKDDTYVFLENCEILTINDDEFTKLKNIWEQYEKNFNIYIDSRLECCAAMLIFHKFDNVIIYDAKSRELENIYIYMFKKYNVILTEEYLKAVCLVILFIKSFGFGAWNLYNINNVLRKYLFTNEPKGKPVFKICFLIDIIDVLKIVNENTPPGNTRPTTPEKIAHFHKLLLELFSSIMNFKDLPKLEKNFNKLALVKALILLNDDGYSLPLWD